MDIVKFKNGKYGIRRTIKKIFKKPRYEFLNNSYWSWSDEDNKSNIYFDSLEKVIDRLDIGEVVPMITRAKNNR